MAHRKLGWKRQPYDHRDWHYRPHRRIMATLSPTCDLTGGMSIQLDQGSIGSCGPNTADEIIMYDQKAEGLAVKSASRLFIYYNTRVLMGTVSEDSGVDNRTLLKALNQSGFCDETLWPYDVSKFTDKPSQPCYAAALANCITNYAAVAVDLTQMKATLSSRFPILFGFDVYNGIMSDSAAATGIVPDPGATETPIGGHDCTVCGFSDVELPGVKPGNVWPAGTFKLRNHWMNSDGTPWGDGGYFYLSYPFATSAHANDLWVINAVPGAPTPPTPTPTPAPAPFYVLDYPIVHQGQRVSYIAPKSTPACKMGFVPQSTPHAEVVVSD
jgi:C1A family cysteine protease